MSLGYYEHVRTRYLLTHEEIFDYRKAKSQLDADIEETRRQVCTLKLVSKISISRIYVAI
jgi:hypothetical protein